MKLPITPLMYQVRIPTDDDAEQSDSQGVFTVQMFGTTAYIYAYIGPPLKRSARKRIKALLRSRGMTKTVWCIPNGRIVEKTA